LDKRRAASCRQWLQVDLGSQVRLVGLQLRSGQFSGDQPLAVTLELDGIAVLATSTVAGPTIELTFPSTLARTARIVLRTPSAEMVAGMEPWWSMVELDGTCVSAAP
jgi:hypothetical protein